VNTVLSIARSFGKINPIGKKMIEKAGFTLIFAPHDVYPLNEGKIIKLLETFNPNALIIGAHSISKPVLDASAKLKLVAMHGVGIDHIDIDYATKKGIAVTCTPDANTIAVAELVIGLLLSISRKIPQATSSIRSGSWETCLGYELFEKTMGVVGTGKIGKAVIQRLCGFGMKIIAFDKVHDPDVERMDVRYATIEEVFKESDFISLHIPLTNETNKMIDRKHFKMMKKTAYFINSSRGAIVDENALYEALSTGGIAGAALDVWTHEPPEGLSKKLAALENVLPTPHIGAHTWEALCRMGSICAQSVIDFLHGKKPAYLVNTEVWHE
jgi:D-3-phosphoglycerate dehydrogenase